MIPRYHAPHASDPATMPPIAPATHITSTVVDLDLCFGQDDMLCLTLTSEDVLDLDDTRLLVRYHSGETLTIYRTHLRWMARRDRVVVVPAPLYAPVAN